MRWQAWLVLPLLLLAVVACALDLPADPRPQAVADPGHHLSADARQRIDGIARDVRAARRGELVVVVIDSSEGRVLRRVGTDLFNRWHLGDRVRNDGVLIIAALTDHRCELVLGTGLDGVAQVAASQSIFDEVMKPRFRAGDTDGALVDGARAAAQRILGVDPSGTASPASASPADPTAGIALEAPTKATPATTPATPVETAQAPPPPVRHEAHLAAPEPWSFLPWLWGGVALAVLVAAWYLRHWWRFHPRRCPGCGAPQTLLGEAVEDAYLDGGERSEERVGSVDHDVWHCPACRRVDKLAWRAWLTSYARCPGCRCRTLSSTSVTLEAATTWSEGRVRVDETCANCARQASHMRSTPRLSSSSSGSSRSGGGSRGGGGGGSW